MESRVEVEAKIELYSCSELEELAGRIEKLGARLEERVYEEDVYYQHPCKDFAETDEALRLRSTRNYTELTYKGPKTIIGGSKSRPEYSIPITDPGQARQILESLGFKPVAIVRKERVYYSYKGIASISFDKVEGLGCFVEVEYKGGGGLEEAVGVVNSIVAMLGLDKHKRVYKSYLELILEKTGGRS